MQVRMVYDGPVSPDGRWRLRTVLYDEHVTWPIPGVTPVSVDDPTRTYYAQLLAATDNTVTRTVRAGWAPDGLGGSFPQLLGWSADSASAFVYTAAIPDGCGVGGQSDDVIRYDLASAAIRAVGSGPGLPTLVADGKYAAYSGQENPSTGELLLLDLDSGEKRRWTFPMGELAGTRDHDPDGVSMSPDEHAVIVTVHYDPCTPEWRTGLLYLDLASGDAIQLVGAPGIPLLRTVLSWSPSGEVEIRESVSPWGTPRAGYPRQRTVTMPEVSPTTAAATPTAPSTDSQSGEQARARMQPTRATTASRAPVPTCAASTPCPDVNQTVPPNAIPAGVMVAWSDCSGVWVVRAGAPARRIADRGDATWLRISPDRRWVAFDVAVGYPLRDLFVASVDGGDVRKIVDRSALASLIPGTTNGADGSLTVVQYYDWVPDSSALAFTTWDWLLPDLVWSGQYHDDLWTAPIVGGELQPVLPAGQGGEFVYSPDAKRVAVTREESRLDREVAVVAVSNADGSGARILLEHAPLSSESDGRTYSVPLWDPEGAHLLVASPQPGMYGPDDYVGYVDGPLQLLRLSLDGAVDVVADAAGGSLGQRWRYNGYWSDDGRWVAYLASPPEPTSSGAPQPYLAPAPALYSPKPIIVARTDGTESARYDDTPWALWAFLFSPDGRSFTYRTGLPGSPAVSKLGRLGGRPVIVSYGAYRPERWLDNRHLLVRDDESVAIARVDDDLRLTVSPAILTDVQGLDAAPAR
jgi:hypothetical protein